MKFIKTIIKHNLGYRPIILLYCERIKGGETCPYFDFRENYITETDFYFYHEKYSKKEFIFKYDIYKTGKKEFVETKQVK